MALAALDRLLTIVVTATLTSAAWIVGGDALLHGAGGLKGVSTPGAVLDVPDSQRATNERGHTAISAQQGRDLIVPVAGIEPAELTDSFTQARAGGARIHEALDIMAPEGTPVLAAAPGKVEKLFLSEAGGKTIYVRSPDGRTIYYYAHLRDYQPGLTEGQTVSVGQRIGSVGITGNANPSGPHLHFAIMRTTPEANWWEPATAVNPYPLLKSR